MQPGEPPPSGHPRRPDAPGFRRARPARAATSLGSDSLASACGAAGSDAVWGFSLDAPAHVTATLAAFPGASLSLAGADECTSATAARAAADADGAARIERWTLGAGAWRLRVDGGSHATGRFQLQVTRGDAVDPPANDTCDGATDLGDGVSGSTRGAQADFAAPCASAPGAPDVVYRLHVADTDTEVALALQASYDAVLAVTAAPCGSPTALACDSGPDAHVLLPALAPGDYDVWVGGWAGGSGTFALSATRSPAGPVPTNQTCATALAVDLTGGPVTLEGSTLRASDTLDPATCTSGPLAGPDVVYQVQVPGAARSRPR